MKCSSRRVFFLIPLFFYVPIIQAANLFNSKYLERFSFATSLGYLTGESREFVYDVDDGRKVSQLNWDLKGEAVIRGEINYQFLDWLDANVRGWVTLGPGGVVMDDYDWLDPNQFQWTDWSHQDQSVLTNANEIDFNLRGWFIQQPNYQFAGMLGYQRTLFSFHDKGGCFIYDNRTNIGCFPPDEIGIGYKQTFNTPYLGLAGNYTIKAFEFSGLFKFSNWVKAQDIDQHYSRGITFYENGTNFNYYNVALTAGYFIKPQIQIFIEGSAGIFPNNPADTLLRDNVTDEIMYAPKGAAGLQNKNYIIALGIKYTGRHKPELVSSK